MEMKFPIFKNKKTNDKQPDYRLSFKDNETWINCASVYVNHSKAGTEYLSVTLDTEAISKYLNNEKNKGYEPKKKEGVSNNQDVVIDPNDLPF